MAVNLQRKFWGGVVCSLIWAAPLAAQDRGYPSGLSPSHDSSIPSTHVAMTADQESAMASQPQRITSEFPLLESNDQNAGAKQEPAGFATPLVTVVSSLAIVLGLFAGLVWLTRKFGGNAARVGSVPNEVLQPLGSTAIDARTRVIMLRCGSRIVVVAQTASGIQPLCEITDPREVHELTVACTGQSQTSFAETLKAAEQKQGNTPGRRAGRLFATA